MPLDEAAAAQDGGAAAAGGEAAAGPGACTAFRAAEKRFQLRREQLYRRRNGRRYGAGLVAAETSLAGVLDPALLGSDGGLAPKHPPAPPTANLTELPTPASVAGVAEQYGAAVHCMGADGQPGGDGAARVVSFAAFPGLYVMPARLTAAQQRALERQCLEDFPNPPSRSNHSAHLGPLPALWRAARRGLHLQQSPHLHQQPCAAPQGAAVAGAPVAQDGPAGGGAARCAVCGGGRPAAPAPLERLCQDCFDRTWAPAGRGRSAASCLDKLRWVTIGPQFQWSERVYDMEGPHQPVPTQLRELSCAAAATTLAVEHALGRPGWQATFRPEAALVNYYGEGDTLNGHVDDVEADQSLPIVSISLGCPAILLMGRETLDAPPAAILLRGGDVVVLAGQARTCYHGVPRVFATGPPSKALQGCGDDEEAALARYMAHRRINLSVRTIT
eukprot:jgi/Tetstr1/434929/TSEL_023926.t1